MSPLPDQFGLQVCGLLGVDHRKTRSIVVRIEAGCVPTVEVEQWLFEDGADELTSIMRQFDIVERGATSAEVGQ